MHHKPFSCIQTGLQFELLGLSPNACFTVVIQPLPWLPLTYQSTNRIMLTLSKILDLIHSFLFFIAEPLNKCKVVDVVMTIILEHVSVY